MKFCSLLFPFLAALYSAAAQPGASPAAATPSDGSLRQRLEDRGIVFNFTYAADAFAVVSGGIQRGVFFNGILDLGTDIDLEKLAGWKGAHFHVNGFYPHGEPGSTNYVGDIGTFSDIEAYDTYRLYELWLEQDLFDHRFSVRAGQITLDSEFAALDSYGGLFIQSGFGAPEAFSANLPLPAFPNAALGLRLRLEPARGFYFQAAVFDGNPAPGLTLDRSPGAASSTEFNRYGTDWALRADEGALCIGEIGYRFNQLANEAEASATRTFADRRAREEPGRRDSMRGLASNFKVGFLYHTDAFANIYDVTLAHLASSLAQFTARNDGGTYAIYFSVEQEVWREPDTASQGLGVFGHAAWMPPDRNFVEFSVEGGLHYRGAIPGRDRDAIGFGVAFLSISDRVAKAVQNANRADFTSYRQPDFEATLELVYRYQASPSVSIQPHAQYVIQPGGTNDIPNALIIGVRTNIAF